MKKVGIAISGSGRRGRHLRDPERASEFYQKTQDVDLEVVSVLELRKDRIEALGIPRRTSLPISRKSFPTPTSISSSK